MPSHGTAPLIGRDTELAALTSALARPGTRLLTLTGHLPHARHPVRVNRLINFVDSIAPPPRRTPGCSPGSAAAACSGSAHRSGSDTHCAIWPAAAPYAFLTDVIGFLPTDPDDQREAQLRADYNAELIEHRARLPQVRDASLYLGGHDELPDVAFGPGLPSIRQWAAGWFEPVPYIVPFDPAGLADRSTTRARLGYRTGSPLLVAAVGGTAVGRDLLELVIEGFRLFRRRRPAARMVLVTGPRIEPKELPDVEGLDKRGYVANLYEHLACADAAVVQGGLATTMELVALRRPFIYFPVHRHWEQQHHVAHRLDHYRAGIRMDFASTSPADLARALSRALLRKPLPRHRARRCRGSRRADRAAAQRRTLMRSACGGLADILADHPDKRRQSLDKCGSLGVRQRRDPGLVLRVD